MFDPTRHLIEEIAQVIDEEAPPKLRSVDELARWAQRLYDEMYLIVDEEGRPVPLSPEQIKRGAALAAERRQREL